MSAVADTDWQAEALRLKFGPRAMPSAVIAEVLGKSASTVRKVVARATTEEINAAVARENAIERAFGGETPEPIPGQTTVDDHLPREPGVGLDWPEMNPETGEIAEPEPDDDPDWTPPTEDELHDDEGSGGALDVGDVAEGLAEFKEEAGEPVGPMPPQPPAREMDQGELVVEKPRLDGTTQFAIDFGDALATDGEVTLTGKFPSGFFKQGDIINGEFTAVVRDVTGKGKLDKASQTIESTKQRHVAEIVDVEVW